MINNQADLKMLLICKTITENFAANISELSQVNPKWTDQYLVSILNRVDRAFNYYLGLNAVQFISGPGTQISRLLKNKNRSCLCP